MNTAAIRPYLTPRQSLQKTFRLHPVSRAEMDRFKAGLRQLLDRIDETESEENVKGHLMEFLRDSGFKPAYLVATKDTKDLVIHTGSEAASPVGVICEVKRPANLAEMPTLFSLNTRAMHELLLYYLRERVLAGNNDIRRLIITNLYEWFIFDAHDFERLFGVQTLLSRHFRAWHEGRKSGRTTEHFYNEIARPYLRNLKADAIPYTYFNLKEYAPTLLNTDRSDDEALVPLLKVLSPTHLLKLPFGNDSNTLNREFYDELLHLIGLEEQKVGGKKVIQRKTQPDEGSLIENTMTILDAEVTLDHLDHAGQYGDTRTEQLFNIALELCITWINRILFLKLLEAQLVNYHRGDQYKLFLRPDRIHDFDQLNKLFFQVLARQPDDRPPSIRAQYEFVPYLNSSLFEVSELEERTLRISSLDNSLLLPFYSGTVLRDGQNRRVAGQASTLHYLLDFLNAYDFASVNTGDIREESKTLINAAVLGLIFEKINGYRDGSFYTPGFITMYMCREAIRKSVVEAFSASLPSPRPSPGGRGSAPPGLGTDPVFASGRAGIGPERSAPAAATPLPLGEGPGERVKPLTRFTGAIRPKLPAQLLENARNLRKEQTTAEQLLWKLLRNRQLNNLKFRRQHPVHEGFILDFYCHEALLAVELDGSLHDEAGQKDYDEMRTTILNELNIEVLRFRNSEVLRETERVLEAIAETCEERLPSPRGGPSRPSPGGRGSAPPGLGTDPVFASGRAGIELERSAPAVATPLPLGEGPGVRAYRDFDDLRQRLDYTDPAERHRANDLINSLRICDPAVGSGHFLVSALNELIAVKAELGILSYRDNGDRVRGYDFSVENDELVIIDQETGRPFRYVLNAQGQPMRDLQRLQETLFHEKQTLIENCLFGVDLNPNSVKICRLRLWIELLKYAYYEGEKEEGRKGKKEEGVKDKAPGSRAGNESASQKNLSSLPPFLPSSSFHLQTLPNIDINIKQGNSLVSRFGLNEDLTEVFRQQKFNHRLYLAAVQSYKNATSKTQKAELLQFIRQIKEQFRTVVSRRDPRRKKLADLRGQLVLLDNNVDLFGNRIRSEKAVGEEKKKLAQRIDELEDELRVDEDARLYRQAFEWRFEFPEVLDDEGNFVGFDVIIGNPPYIRQEEIKDLKPYLSRRFQTYSGTADLLVYFIEWGLTLLKPNGQFSYIVANKFMRAGFGRPLRKWLRQWQLAELYDFGDLPVFEEATTYPLVLSVRKAPPYEPVRVANVQTLDFPNLSAYLTEHAFAMRPDNLADEGWTLSDAAVSDLLRKIQLQGEPLGQYVGGKIYRGVLTGLNEAFVIDADTRQRLIEADSRSAEVIKPFLAGRDVKRYQVPREGTYLILIPSGFTQKQFGKLPEAEAFDKMQSLYPAILSYLKAFEVPAKKRSDKGQYWWELRACDYYEEFAKPKLVFPDIAVKMQVCYLVDEVLFANTCYMIPKDDKFLLSVMNSKLMLFTYQAMSASIRGGYMRFFKQYVEQLPIKSIPPENQAVFIQKVEQILAARRTDPQADTAALETDLDRMVYQLYDLTDEEIAVVEGVGAKSP